MASDYVLIGVMDGPAANVTEWSTHLSFTGSQVVERLLSVFHKEGDPDTFGLLLRQGRNRRHLPLDRTLAESGVVHGDVLELRSVKDALDPGRGKVDMDTNVQSSVTETKMPPKAASKPAKKPRDRWEIIRSLSEGAQAHTFLVRDSSSPEKTTRYVQKRLKNKKRIQRFKREIEASLKLSHKNVIEVEDYDLEGKTPYLVTEYCEQGALSESEIQTREPVYALEVFAAICRGVGHAHSQTPAIVHRDLKPENIFIRGDGSPVVGD